MNAVELSDLERHYRTPAGPVLALNGVELRIELGERVAIMGPSGCGKSTLVSVIGALEAATSGSTHVLGTDLGRLDDKQRTRWRRENVGFIFQDYDLLPFLSAAENVALQAGLARHRGAPTVLELLDHLDLAAHAQKRPDQLSGGQKQRVGIARGLIHAPRLVLADEPTGGLDTQSSSLVVTALLAHVAESGATAIVVTHDPVVARAFDRTISLLDGRVVDDPAAPGTHHRG